MGQSRRILGLFARAILLRCPRCGAAPVLNGWFTVRPDCRACHLRFDRGEPGYFMGAGCLNLVVAELVFAVGLLAVLVATWPTPPWNAMLYSGVPLMVVFPILFFPWSRTLWLAFDFTFRPAEPRDDLAQGSDDAAPRSGD